MRMPPAVAVPGPNASQEELAGFLLRLLSELNIVGILVGTTAALATGAMNTASKDADAVAVTRKNATLRKDLRRLAKELGLTYSEQGWGVLTLQELVVRDGDFEPTVAWAVDVILPAGGMIPYGAALLISKHSQDTRWGAAAVPEHIVATKAVAAADRASEGQPLLAMKYEQHLEQMAESLGPELRWGMVREVLLKYATHRRKPAAGLIKDIFGTDPMQYE